MLTPHQKKMIAELEVEFSKMNQSQKIKSNLVKELLDEINVERRALKELSAYNENILYASYGKLQRDAEDLKEFYAQDGIMLDVRFSFSKGTIHFKTFKELLEFDNPENYQDVAIYVYVYHLGLQRAFAKGEIPLKNEYITKYYLTYRAENCGEKTFYKAHISKDYRNLLEKSTDSSRFRSFLKSILESA